MPHHHLQAARRQEEQAADRQQEKRVHRRRPPLVRTGSTPARAIDFPPQGGADRASGPPGRVLYYDGASPTAGFEHDRRPRRPEAPPKDCAMVGLMSKPLDHVLESKRRMHLVLWGSRALARYIGANCQRRFARSQADLAEQPRETTGPSVIRPPVLNLDRAGPGSSVQEKSRTELRPLDLQ